MARRAPVDGSGTTSRRTRLARVPKERHRSRRKPPDGPGTASHRTPFCASSSKERKGCGLHDHTDQELLRAALRFARVPQKSAKGGARKAVQQGKASGTMLEGVEVCRLWESRWHTNGKSGATHARLHRARRLLRFCCRNQSHAPNHGRAVAGLFFYRHFHQAPPIPF